VFDFDYWFDGIVGTCNLIADNEAFRRAWLLEDQTITSIHYYDEMFEQLVGDLHLEESIVRFANILSASGSLETVQAFATALHELDGRIECNEELQNPRALLGSREWRSFQLAAKRVLDLPIAQKYLGSGPPQAGVI